MANICHFAILKIVFGHFLFSYCIWAYSFSTCCVGSYAIVISRIRLLIGTQIVDVE